MKDPFPVSDPSLKDYLARTGILLNMLPDKTRTEDFKAIFADNSIDGIVMGLLDRRDGYFRALSDERRDKFSYLPKMAIHLASRFLDPRVLENLMAGQGQAAAYKGEVDLGTLAETNIVKILYRVKEEDSFGEKFLRSAFSDDSTHIETGRHDMAAMTIVAEHEEAKNYLHSLPWSAFLEGAKKELVCRTAELAGNYSQHSETDVRRRFRALGARLVSRGKLPEKCRDVSRFFHENADVLEKTREYNSLHRLLHQHRSFAFLSRHYKREYHRMFFEKNRALLDQIATRIVEDPRWITVPDNHIVMKVPMTGVSDFEREVSVRSLVLAGLYGESLKFEEADYLLFNSKRALRHFLENFYSSLEHTLLERGAVLRGTRHHRDGLFSEEANYCMFLEDRLLVYVSGSSSTATEVTAGFLQEAIGRRRSEDDCRSLQDRLQATINEAKRLSLAGKLRHSALRRISDDIFSAEKAYLDAVVLDNSGSHAIFVMADTFRKDIVSKFWLQESGQWLTDRRTFLRDYYANKSKKYNSLHLAVCLHDKKLTSQLQLHSPETFFNANDPRGDAYHPGYKEKEKETVPAMVRKIGYLLLQRSGGRRDAEVKDFHLQRIAYYKSGLFENYSSMNERSKAAALSAICRSYSALCHDGLADRNIKRQMKNLVVDFCRTGPLQAYSDITKATNLSGVRELSGLYKSSLNILSEKERSELNVRDTSALAGLINPYYSVLAKYLLKASSRLTEFMRLRPASRAQAQAQTLAHEFMHYVCGLMPEPANRQQQKVFQYYQRERNKTLEKALLCTRDWQEPPNYLRKRLDAAGVQLQGISSYFVSKKRKGMAPVDMHDHEKILGRNGCCALDSWLFSLYRERYSVLEGRAKPPAL